MKSTLIPTSLYRLLLQAMIEALETMIQKSDVPRLENVADYTQVPNGLIYAMKAVITNHPEPEVVMVYMAEIDRMVKEQMRVSK